MYKLSVWLGLVLLLGTPAGAAETAIANSTSARKATATACVSESGVEKERRCFRDRNRNQFCDNGTRQGGRCKNNCRLKPDATGKPQPAGPRKKTATGCAGCPLAGQCTHCIAAFLVRPERG